MTQELSKDQLRELDNEFENYQGIDIEIAKIKAAIQYMGDTDPDENIGGGRGGRISKPQQTLIEKWDASPALQRLWRIQRECDAAVKRMTPDQKHIYELKFCGGDYHTWDEVGDLVGYAHTPIYRKRYAILSILAQENGMMLKLVQN